MTAETSKGATGPMNEPHESAISQIVQMNPRRVTVALTLPVTHARAGPTVSLEWSREDTTMPLSDLLKRIESYVREYGPK